MPQAVMGGARAHCDSVVAFSQTDFNKQGHRHASLIMHGHDDKIVAYADSAPLQAKVLKNETAAKPTSASTPTGARPS